MDRSAMPLFFSDQAQQQWSLRSLMACNPRVVTRRFERYHSTAGLATAIERKQQSDRKLHKSSDLMLEFLAGHQNYCTHTIPDHDRAFRPGMLNASIGRNKNRTRPLKIKRHLAVESRLSNLLPHQRPPAVLRHQAITLMATSGQVGLL